MEDIKIEMNIAEGNTIYGWLLRVDRLFAKQISTINIIISISLIVLAMIDFKYTEKISIYVSSIILFIFSILPKLLYEFKSYFEKNLLNALLAEKEKGLGYLTGVDSYELKDILSYISIKGVSNDEWTQIKFKTAPYLFIILYLKLKLKIYINYLFKKYIKR